MHRGELLLGGGMATLFGAFSDHLVFKILHLLSDADILSLAQTCRAVRAICDEDWPVWGPRCELYGFSSHQGWARSFKHLYLSLLCKFGRLLQPHVCIISEEDHPSETKEGSSIANSRRTAAEAPLGLWYAQDAPFGGLLMAIAEPPAIVLYSVTVHRLNGPVKGHPVLSISIEYPTAAAAVEKDFLRLMSDRKSGLDSSSESDAGFPSNVTGQSARAGLGVPPGVAVRCLLFARQGGQCQAAADDPLGNLKGHAAAARFLESDCQSLQSHQSGEVNHTQQAFAFRCITACRHIDFDPLLRHTGHLGTLAESVIWKDLPMGSQSSASTAPQAGETPEIGTDFAIQMSRFQAMQHTGFVHGSPDRDRQLYRGHSRPKGTTPDDILYLPLKIGSGHRLAGLWRGSYGVHGVEIINFSQVSLLEGQADVLGGWVGLHNGSGVEMDTGLTAISPASPLPCSSSSIPMILGVKVTGDSNVPAGQVSVAIDVSAPPNQYTSTTGQRPGSFFALPHGCHTGVVIAEHSLKILAIYEGSGHIAETDFRHDSWTPLEVFEFEPHSIGILWRELGSFSLFTRLSLLS